jgi:hypothetical protein
VQDGGVPNLFIVINESNDNFKRNIRGKLWKCKYPILKKVKHVYVISAVVVNMTTTPGFKVLHSSAVLLHGAHQCRAQITND